MGKIYTRGGEEALFAQKIWWVDTNVSKFGGG